MDILSLLGGRILWVGDESSMQQLVFSLMPDQFKMVHDAAVIDRAEHLRKVEAKERERETLKASVRAKLGAVGDAGVRVMLADDEDEEEDDAEKYRFHSATYRVIDGVAIIGIKGALVNSESWFLRYLGKVGYPHISDQLLRAYNDSEVQSVLLEISSPGGAVLGIDEVSKVIKAVDTVKPVTAVGIGIMCSGGYWLGSSARHITATPLTEVGSIGVVMTHTEYSKMMEKAGITNTVLRKGEYKALMSSVEPLSDKARAEALKAMDVIYDSFTQHVAVGRGVTQQYVKDNMAEGRVFWGAEARQVGLVDAVGDLGSALAYSKSLVQTPAATVY